MGISQRHHFLPEFFIKGFTDETGNYWVYDKLYDKISSKPQKAAMRFYEKKRNTITVKGEEVDIVEKTYQKIEDKIKVGIINSRNADSLDDAANLGNIAYILAFIVSTFWRIPQNDELNKSLLEFYENTKNDWGSFIKLSLLGELSAEDKIKIAKIFIPFEILNEAVKFNGQKKKVHYKIVEFSGCFLISDNPVLFPRTPTSINDFQDSLIFPISKSRALIFFEADHCSFDEQTLKMTNLLLIHQAKRYVGFHSKEMLESYIAGYRHFKKIGEYTSEVKKRFFAKMNQ